MGIQKLFCQRETDARTDMMALMFLVHFVIAFPNIINILIGDPVSVIIDIDPDPAFDLFTAQNNLLLFL